MKTSQHIEKLKFSMSGSKSLTDYPTHIPLLYKNRSDAESQLEEAKKNLSLQQEKLSAVGEHSLLIILQGMDTAGKDGLIKHVTSGFNPQALIITSFKVPTQLERNHDFIWRAHMRAPERGQIGIFNRSYYEDVIVPRVHPQMSRLKNQLHLHDRLEDIVNFERYLQREGTRIVKVFLHLSRHEQRARLLQRIEDPHKNWKIDPSDLLERQSWLKYQRAYEECFQTTSISTCPWHILPADDKENARILFAQILSKNLHEMHLHFPTPSHQKIKQMKSARRALGPK